MLGHFFIQKKTILSIFLLFGFFSAVVNVANAVPTTLGNWDPNNTNVMDAVSSVIVEGDYAYVTGYHSDNMVIVDISNTASPVVVGNWDTNEIDTVAAMKVRGNYAYLGGANSNNMVIVDISNPASPVTVGNWDPNNTNVMHGAHGIAIAGIYAYITGSASDNMVIVDISNPASPTTVSNWDPNNLNVMEFAISPVIIGNYVYIGGHESDNMAIVDISNPASPTTVSNWDPNDLNVMESTHSVFVDGNYAYIAGSVSDNFAIVDISNPASPTTVSNWDPNDPNVMDVARKVIVSGDYAYVAGTGSDNLAIVDISNSASPTTVGNWDPNNTNIMNDAYAFAIVGDLAYVGGFISDNLAIVSLEGEVTIQDPNSTNVDDAVNNGYIILDNGTIDNTTSTTTQVDVTFQSPTTNAIFPTNTQITEVGSGNFNFENFITQNTISEEQEGHPNVVGAVRIGIPNTNLSFSNDITVEMQVSSIYNDMELEVLSQLEGSSTWNNHTTCTITNGICSFATNHATTYIVNGDGTISGSEDIDISIEVTETLSLDCYDNSTSSGDTTITLGIAATPGVVTAGLPAVGVSTCDVTTNDDQGYYLSLVNSSIHSTGDVLEHQDPNTSLWNGITEINLTAWDWDETTHTGSNRVDWDNTNPTGLGFTVMNIPESNANNPINTSWTTGTTGGICPEGISADTNIYAGIPTSAEAISAVVSYQANTTTTDTCYKVDVTPSQPSGTYIGQVTYTATSDASSYYN